MKIKKEKEFLEWVEGEVHKACTTDKIGLMTFPNSYICHHLRIKYDIDPNFVEYFEWMNSRQGKKVVRLIKKVAKSHGMKQASGGNFVER